MIIYLYNYLYLFFLFILSKICGILNIKETTQGVCAMADKKIFKKTVSDRLKKALIVGAALFALGGVQEAQAQGILYKIGKTIKEVNHVINQELLIPTDIIQHEAGRLGRNIERLDINTGGVISGTAQAIAVQRAQKAVREQVEQNGTYQVSVQELSQSAQTSRTSNSEYLNNVKNKLHKNSTESSRNVQVRTNQQTQKRTTQTTQRRASSQDVQNVLDILEGGRPY